MNVLSAHSTKGETRSKALFLQHQKLGQGKNAPQ